jgi:hypothetical protein
VCPSVPISHSVALWFPMLRGDSHRRIPCKARVVGTLEHTQRHTEGTVMFIIGVFLVVVVLVAAHTHRDTDTDHRDEG